MKLSHSLEYYPHVLVSKTSQNSHLQLYVVKCCTDYLLCCIVFVQYESKRKETA